MSYAKTTTVAVEKSRAELEGVLRRYGCTGFVSGWNHNQVLIGFEVGEGVDRRSLKFTLLMPSKTDPEIARSHGGRRTRAPKQREQALAQEERRRWRALCLVVKAKLEAVESGIATFDDEFLSYMVLPGGQTVAEVVRPTLLEAYRTGSVGQLLPGLPAPKDL